MPGSMKNVTEVKNATKKQQGQVTLKTNKEKPKNCTWEWE